MTKFQREIPSVKHLLGHGYELKDDSTDEPGMLKCVFSVFDKPDRAGDIVRRSALADHDGKEVPLVWSHDWDRIIGKGTLEVQDDRAIWKGRFFTDTQDGMEAYKTVKNLGSLQQYSWGFRILEAEIIEDDDNDSWWPALEILKTDIFEVSPVLVGQNQYTGTLAVKGNQPSGLMTGTLESSMGSFTFIPNNTGTYRQHYPTNVPGYDFGQMGITVTTTTTTNTPSTTPDPEPPDDGKRFADEIEDALAATSAILERAHSLAETRAQEDRKIGTENLDRLRQHAEQLREVVQQVDALLASQCPVEMVPMSRIDDRAKTNDRRRKLLQMGI